MTAAPFTDRLAAARRLVGYLDANRDRLLDEIPIWRRDQMEAAVTDAERVHRAITVACRVVDPDRWGSPREAHGLAGGEMNAHLIAAAMGCRPCVHIRRGGAPGIHVADLNGQRVVCRRCAGTYWRPVENHRCEVCDKYVDDNVFVSINVQVGNLLLVGNIGAGCCGWLLEGEAA